jgi:hypothetical protein
MLANFPCGSQTKRDTQAAHFPVTSSGTREVPRRTDKCSDGLYIHRFPALICAAQALG